MGDRPATPLLAAFVLGTHLLSQFHHSVALPASIAAFNQAGLTALTGLQPGLERGSWVAFGLSYSLIALLILSTVLVFGWSRLPGSRVRINSAEAERTGLIFIGLFCTGCWLLVQQVWAGLRYCLSWFSRSSRPGVGRAMALDGYPSTPPNFLFD
uniref:Uncharacterized protein n=1 Tax=Cyanothece sp. (strain PCC 7425 / ATCC 29141) TaxID=395961 RepID=B8HTK7_CYAP4